MLGTYGHLTEDIRGHYGTTSGQTKVLGTIALSKKIVGAGDGDRTRMASLEGWSSTIELHPHLSNTEKTILGDAINVSRWKNRSSIKSAGKRSLSSWWTPFTALSSKTPLFVPCTPRI